MHSASTPDPAETETDLALAPDLQATGSESPTTTIISASTPTTDPGPNKINVLKKLRSERQLTIAQLAELADLNPATISLIENNRRKAQGTTLGKLATFFGVSPDALWEIADTGAAERGALGGAAGRGRTKPRNGGTGTGTGNGTGNECQDATKAKAPAHTRTPYLPPNPKSSDLIPNVFVIDSPYPTFGAASPPQPTANSLKVEIEEFEPGSVEYRLAHHDKTLTVGEVLTRLAFLRFGAASDLSLRELTTLPTSRGSSYYQKLADWLQSRLQIKWD